MNILEARRRTLGGHILKKTAQGNPAIATDSLARRYPGIEMQGWTEQDSTTGAQLLNLTENTVTDSGITCVSEGSTIIISGERVVGDGGGLTYVTSTFTLQPGTYRFSYEKFNDVNSSILVAILMKQADNKILGNAFTLSKETNLYIGVNIRQGKTADNAVIRCMLNAGSEALPYEPYTGGAPSPSPEYPQEITSAGNWNETAQKWEYELEMNGAQLFDESDIQVVSVNSEGAQRNGFEITGLKPGQYTISAKQKTISTSAYLYEKVKNSSGEYGKVQYVVTDLTTFTVTTSISSGDTLIIYDAMTSNSMEVSKSIFAECGIMLNPGSAALPYQPYHTPQTVTLQSDRPLTKWDKLEKRNGQWGWVYKSEEIESYTDESVPGEYYSTTGQLSVGAQVWYETTTETFAPLTTTEQEAMEALHTYRPTTVLSNDAGCEMSLTYKTRKSMEVTA